MTKLLSYKCKDCGARVYPKIESLAYGKKLCARCLDKKYTTTQLFKMQLEKESRQGQYR